MVQCLEGVDGAGVIFGADVLVGLGDLLDEFELRAGVVGPAEDHDGHLGHGAGDSGGEVVVEGDVVEVPDVGHVVVCGLGGVGEVVGDGVVADRELYDFFLPGCPQSNAPEMSS